MIDLEHIKQEANAEITIVKTAKEIESIKIKYLGRKQGVLVLMLRALKDLSPNEKQVKGPLIQKLKNDIESAILFKEKEIKNADAIVDITLPGSKIESGHLNLITQVEEEIRKIFNSMNFSVIDGPEIEGEYYNFDALNIPLHHPARDMWDTFWIKSEEKIKQKYLLRTHTSPVQMRYMENNHPPFQIISIGKVFRYEATDATHETNFHQVEGLMIGKDISLASFKFIISEFFKQFFPEKDITIRFRSSFFPFVEPGIEVDIKLDNSKWLEMGGAGMVHPRLLKNAGYNPNDWQGFAFGLGMERLAMIKYKIPDIRFFHSQDLKFIKKF